MTRATKGPVERASAADRAFLAMDSGAVPEQFGIVLVLDPPADGSGEPDVARVRDRIAARLGAAPRLRERLVGTPPGAGGPVWVDDPGFALTEHVHALACPAPGDEQTLLDCALAAVMTPLPRDAPLWSATAVTGLDGGRWALVVVLHHVLSDGVGGLAVLGALVDGAGTASSTDRTFPRSPPVPRDLYVDAFHRRTRSVRSARRGWRQLRDAMSAAGGALPPRAAATSLLQRTGPRRAARVLHVDLEALRGAVHPWGASANDAVLVAVSAALGRVQSARGEDLPQLVVTVPVSGRPAAQAGSAGNMVSPLLVPVPTGGALVERLRVVAGEVRAGKAAATGPPPIALLGWVFRSIARLGGFRWYMNHQHRFHTLVSHVRGPREQLRFDGCPIVRALPIGVGESGNAPVHFVALSYAGDLALTVTADPDHFHDLDALAAALQQELDRLLALPRPTGVKRVAP